MIRVKRKGQTWSFDLIVAVVLFIVVVALFYTFLSGDKYEDQVQGLEAASNTISTRLNCDISSDSGVCIIEKGKVQETKLNALATKEYEDLKVEFGISGDFCIYLRSSSTGAIIPMGGNELVGVGKDSLLLINETEGPNPLGAVYCGDAIADILNN